MTARFPARTTTNASISAWGKPAVAGFGVVDGYGVATGTPSVSSSFTDGGSNWKRIDFTSDSTLVVSVGGLFDCMLVGGGGGFAGGGGGGGGGQINITTLYLAAGTYDIDVGAAGSPSQIKTTALLYSYSYAGGYGGLGGDYNGTGGGSGGSGGGGGYGLWNGVQGGGSPLFTGAYGGFSGAAGNTGGGGGAGAAASGSTGGAGLQLTFTGTSTYYSNGGGGSGGSAGTGGSAPGRGGTPGGASANAGIIVVRWKA